MGAEAVRQPGVPAKQGPVATRQAASRTPAPERAPGVHELQRHLGNRAVANLFEGAGQPLPEDVRQRMEAAFGADLGGVRVHDDEASARAASLVRARAFTAGDHVFFGASRYAPGTVGGEHLLAHELAHVVQQRGGATAAESDGSRGESEAHLAAADVMAGRLPRLGTVRPVGLLRAPNTPADFAQQKREDIELMKRSPPLWLSLLGPAYVAAYYRNPAQRAHNPAVQGAVDLNTKGAAAGGAGATTVTAAAAVGSATITSLAIGGAGAYGIVVIGVEAAAGSAALAPVVNVVFTHPLAAVEAVHFAAGTAVNIAAAGGFQNWLRQIATPEGAIQVAFDIFVFRAQMRSADGSTTTPVQIKGKVTKVTATGIQGTITQGPPPPAAPSPKAAPPKAAPPKASPPGPPAKAAPAPPPRKAAPPPTPAKQTPPPPPTPGPVQGAAPVTAQPAAPTKAPPKPRPDTVIRGEGETEEADAPKATTKPASEGEPPQSKPPPSQRSERAGVVLDQETIESFNQMWRDKMVEDPERAHVYQRYIDNNLRRRNLLSSNAGQPDALAGEQSETEMQFLYSTRNYHVPVIREKDGVRKEGFTIPDGIFGNQWAIEIKNWNVLRPSREQCQAVGSNRLPSQFQKLVDQVQDRRPRFGDKQAVIIDVRGQLSLTGVSPEEAAANNELIMTVRRNIAAACRLPVQQVEVVVW